MKSFAIFPCIALATIAGTAKAGDIQPFKAETIQPYKAESVQPRNAGAVQPRNAETIQPRNADAVQSRNADAVQSRNAETVQPRNADAVQSRFADAVQSRFADTVQERRAPSVKSTAVHGSSVSAWNWQKVGNTGVANGGLGRGSQLVNIRCAGLACSAYQETGGGWAIRGEGGFPEISGTTLDVRLMNLGTKRAQADTRRRGIFSDGSFWDIISTYELPAGSYAVFYVDAKRDQPFAAITFDVQRHAVAGTASNPAQAGIATNNAPGANQNLINQYRRNALCLGAAAMNPDIRCVPGG